MTVLDDRGSKASGTTQAPEPPPQLPIVDAAQDFYIYGSAVQLGWVTSRPLSLRFQWIEAWERLLGTVAADLRRLRALPPGWDGRRARRITPAAIRGTLEILARLLEVDPEPPHILPLPTGGIQLEWLAAGNEIEIEIDEAGLGHVLAESANGQVIAEGDLNPGHPAGLITVVEEFLKELSASVAVQP